jgi:hypothetical protein
MQFIKYQKSKPNSHMVHLHHGSIKHLKGKRMICTKLMRECGGRGGGGIWSENNKIK